MAPKAFVSYASEDRDTFVTGFATKLLENGVEAWYDRWEIEPGDSLVDEIFPAIGEADAVIIILSRNSVKKLKQQSWIRAEHTVSIAKRVVGKLKVIPVVIDDCEIPDSLEGITYVKIRDVEDYSGELTRILMALYGVTERPSVGAPPAFIQEALTSVSNIESITDVVSGLAPLDSLVLKLACETAIQRDEPYLHVSSLADKATSLGISEEDLQEALEILESEGYINKTSKIYDEFIVVFWITGVGFDAYAKVNLADYASLQQAVARQLAQDAIHSETIAEALEQPHMIVQFILYVFRDRGLVQLIEVEQ